MSRGIDLCTCSHDRSEHDPDTGQCYHEDHLLGVECECLCFFPHPQPNSVKFAPAPVDHVSVVLATDCPKCRRRRGAACFELEQFIGGEQAFHSSRIRAAFAIN